jgi:formylglycine-generating enzyme required for sulfatase activity
MHGNAWEWVADWYEVYSRKSVTDPQGPRSGTDRVYRGGSVNYSPGYLRSANRTATAPTFDGFEFLPIGFRVSLDLPN